MKEYEKFAREAIYDLHTYSIHEITAGALIELERKAFVLGFLKARKMAEDTLMTRSNPRVEEVLAVRKLGEKEI